ncbi:polyribonucleotide nucleotidyltransferase [bacterium (Candidatus Howlettbacteria) CG_4_10_14_0_8_um_filter_40_9]|nr:MAG: polyribonucleotide nucleotidyltransferase [bacterium (Candidatus Howlettbacteria) CG_4_10_14_0_8_um_filter_40_9]
MHAEKSDPTKGPKIINLKTDFGGKELTLETGKLSLLADGSVTLRYNDTVILATVVVKKEADMDKDYFPLTVEFQDKWYATGKISGSRFIKREARPSELAMLRSRMIDRPIRPMFPKGFMNETQIIVTPLSYDFSIDPAVLGLTAASAALMITGAPFEGPIGAVRIGRIDGKLVVNPTIEEMGTSDLDLLVAGTEEAITMIEGGAKQIPENELEEALSFAHKAIQPVIEIQKKLVKELNVEPLKYELVKAKTDIYDEISKYLADKLGESVRHKDKIARNTLIAELEDNVLTFFAEKFEEAEISQAFEKVIKDEVRRSILEEGNRPDHRKFDELRDLSSEAGILPRTHGSALFQRGQTQVLSTVTLASPSKAQLVESMDQEFSKKYMHHYVDTPASYGETGRLGAGRRAIGHGFLAEKALEAVLPLDSDFPYTIRVVSEILSCNGSSSMGSVCGSSLALMDAGVPITDSVAGIAMGLITTDGDLSKKHVILTDIQGAEDFAGDMDFKLAGTRKGTTAIQMDIKVKGLTIEFLAEVIKRSKEARIQILDVMDAAIAKPRTEMSEYAPRLTMIKIDTDKIREVIGKGGEVINKIIAETGAEIDIEDDGTIIVASADAQGAKNAVEMINNIVRDPEVGKIYDGKVVKIMDFGAFVEFLPGKEGLVHISELADHRVEKVEDEVKEGEAIKVKLLKKDDQGRFNLSRKEAREQS